jgi:hypothetical protein
LIPLLCAANAYRALILHTPGARATGAVGDAYRFFLTAFTSIVVEVKADNQMSNEKVLAKREAAKRWVNAINDSGQVHDMWHYLLVAQRDIRDAKDSWPALRGPGT